MNITKFDRKACTKINRILNKQSNEELIDVIITLRALIVLDVLSKEPEYLELSDYLTHEAYRRGIDL